MTDHQAGQIQSRDHQLDQGGRPIVEQEPDLLAVRARCRAPRRATAVTTVAGWRPVGRNAGRHTARDLSTR